MKKLGTLVAGLLLVCGMANAADYVVNTQVNWKNDGGNDPHAIEWEVANGYMALGDNTTFTFDIDKTFYELSNDESFAAEVGITQRLPSTEMMGKVLSNEISLRFAVAENEGAIDNNDTTRLVYVSSTNLAGVSTALELVGALEEETDKYEANAYLGKGFGPFNLSVEYKNAVNPNASGDDKSNTALNTFLNYNYNLGMGFAFNTEFAFIADKFEIGNEGTATVYAAPQLKYSYSLNEEATFYTGVVYEALKGTTDKLFDEDFSKVDGNGKVYLGFTYAK